MTDPPVDAAEPPAGRTQYAELFRNANYVRVFCAGLGSVAGSAIAGVCLIWLVAERTHSAWAVAFLALGYVAGAVAFSLFGGTLVDRYDRRRLMIAADVCRGVAMAAVTAELLLGGFDLPLLVAAYAVVGAFTTIFNPAEQAIVPQLVGPVHIADANGLIRSSRSTLQFVGSAVAGGLLVTVGPAAGLGANALTFAFSAALLTGMRLPPRPEAEARRAATPYVSDLLAGFRWLWRAKAFLQLTVSATFFNFCSTIVSTFLVFFATLVLHGGALDYAFLLAAQVGGSVVGALLVGPTGAVRWAGPAWTIPYGAVSGAFVLGIALWPSLPLAFVAFFALGALAAYAGTAWLTAAQLIVPADMQGRYYGVDGFGSVAILPVAQLVGAFLVEGYGARETYLVVAVVWIVVGAVFLIPRALRELGYRPGPPTPLTSRSAGDGAGTSGSPGGTQDG